jgi:hypothetical protein
MDELNLRRKIDQIEIHIMWIKGNLGDGPVLRRRIAEISKLRAIVAKEASVICVLIDKDDSTLSKIGRKT